jgi:hypothetical protein
MQDYILVLIGIIVVDKNQLRLKLSSWKPSNLVGVIADFPQKSSLSTSKYKNNEMDRQKNGSSPGAIILVASIFSNSLVSSTYFGSILNN